MKKILQFIKNNIPGFILGLVIAGVVGVYAVSVASSDVTYDNSVSGSSATTVKAAIDDLYSKTVDNTTASLPAYVGKTQRWANGSSTTSSQTISAGTYILYVVQASAATTSSPGTAYNLPPTMSGYSTITTIQAPTKLNNVYYAIYEVTFNSNSTFTFVANANSSNYQALHYSTYVMFKKSDFNNSVINQTPSYLGMAQRWANGDSANNINNVEAGTYIMHVVQACTTSAGGAATLYNLQPFMSGYSSIKTIQSTRLAGEAYYTTYEVKFDTASDFLFLANSNPPNYQVYNYATYFMLKK